MFSLGEIPASIIDDAVKKGYLMNVSISVFTVSDWQVADDRIFPQMSSIAVTTTHIGAQTVLEMICGMQSQTGNEKRRAAVSSQRRQSTIKQAKTTMAVADVDGLTGNDKMGLAEWKIDPLITADIRVEIHKTSKGSRYRLSWN